MGKNSHSFLFLKTGWIKLKKNKAAVAGLLTIMLAIIVAVFAYYIAPDHTPYANRMMVEIGGQKPGFSMQFLLLPKEREVEKVSFFGRLLHGQEDEYYYIPITASYKKNDSTIVDKYIDAGLTESRAFAGTYKVKTQHFWLGTDKYGRDILSRLIVGVRVSLAVGFIAVFISISIGILLGLMAGYYGGRTDNIIMWFINVIWSIPTLLLVFAITIVLGKGFMQVFIAVGLTLWVNAARIIRTQVFSVKQLQYVEAARALGYSHRRIMFRHIFPNVSGPVLVVAASNFASAIVIEAGLSFLGVGVQPPQPSWGLMIKENYNFIITNNPALAIAPGLCIMILVLAFNMVGNGLRDVADVRNTTTE